MMKKNLVIGLIAAIAVILILFVSFRGGEEIEPNITADLNVSNRTPAEELTGGAVIEEVNETVNETVEEEPEPIVEEIPELYKACRYSAIMYAGCDWTNDEKTEFDLTIESGAVKKIPGVWFVIYSEDDTKYIKNEQALVSGSSRIYSFIYSELSEGDITKFEVLPIEDINGTEVACYNQRAAFVPLSNCKLPAIDMGE